MPIRKWASAQIVNTITSGNQFDPSIATLADGGYVVVWQDVGFIRGQRYDAAGAKVGAEFLIDNDPGNFDPSVTGLSGGGFVVSYSDPLDGNPSNIDVDALLYDSNGALVGFPGVDGSPGNQQQSELTRNGTGYAAVYTDFNVNSGDIFLKRFDAAGALQGVVAVNNTVTGGAQRLADVAELAGGGNLAVVWANAFSDLRLRVLSSTGGDVTLGEVVVNTTAIGLVLARPQVTSLANGGFVVTWESSNNPLPGSSIDQRARLFDAGGAPAGNDFLVNTTTAGYQGAGEVASLASGGFVIVWVDVFTGFIRGQVYDAVGAKAGSEFIVDVFEDIAGDDAGYFGVTGLADGRFVVTWTGLDSGGGGVHSQIFDPRDGVVNGTNTADTLYGNDSINDEISGYAGADTLHGLNGNDQLYGGSENDAIFGGKGDDTAYGGTGDDTLTGDVGDDDLFGEDGNDSLIGGIGADHLGGGSGTDRVSYGSAAKSVIVSLSNPAINSGDALGDTFSSIENISGSAFNDALNGNSAANAINGGAGNDIIKGYAGNDTLTGYSGADIFVFNTALNAATNIDRITDFNAAADTIQLDDAVFTALAGGTLAAAAFKDVAVAAKDASDRILYNSGTGNLYYDADGSGAAFAAIKFVALTGNPAITAANFVVI